MNISIFSVCKHCKTSSADPAVAQDIGYGDRGSGVTFTLSGNAAVFLENDSYIIPTILGTQAHYHPVPFVGNTANGIIVPAAWATAQGAFLPPMPTPTPTPAIIAPQTGDSSRMSLWIALAGISAVTISLLTRRKRRA